MKDVKKIKKIAIIFGMGLFLIFVGILSWHFFFSRYYQFQKQENMFLEGTKSYYDTYSRYLPRKGETREVTLQDLYDAGKVDTLYVPGSKKLCDPDSWVRVYQNEDGDYEYFVNLECDYFKSKIDRKGPEIELSGDKNIIVDYGVEYKDPGVKSVRDDTDGKMDIKKVTVDTSKVNTNRPGLYKVTYTAYDKILNETKIVRNVQVVDKLYSFVTRNTDETNYYRGSEIDNYVQFSGMLWRIVNVNADNSVKLVLANVSSNVIFGTQDKFVDSNVYHWLKDYFYPHLKNSEKYIVQNASWCSNHAIYDIESLPQECNNETFSSPIGLLNVKDLVMSSKDLVDSYLVGKQYYWLLDRVNSDNIDIVYSSGIDGFMSWNGRSYSAVRPVINLTTDTYIMSGSGTIDKPYKLNDYEYAKENEQIKDRYDGEYFSYSGYLFRKIDTDKDGNVKMIMANNMKNSETQEQYTLGYKDSVAEWRFDPKVVGNVGHTLNEELILYLNDKSVVQHEFEVPEIDPDQYFDQWTKTRVKSMLALPTSYDLFSAYNILSDSLDFNFLLLDYSPTNEVTFVNTGNSMAFTMDQEILGDNTVKVVLYLKGNLKIASGRGLYDNPYYIK